MTPTEPGQTAIPQPPPALPRGGTGTATQAWTERPERGSEFLLRLMLALTQRLGRGAARILLGPITLYFWLATPKARADSRRYLARVLDRPAGMRDTLRHYWYFASTVLDRVFLAGGRLEKFDFDIHGQEHLDAAINAGNGAFLVGAHLGSFDALRALGRATPGLRVSLAMYEANAAKVGRMLRSVDPALAADIVALGRVDSMLRIQERLARHDFVGFLADRWIGEDRTIEVPFLDVPAPLPTGAFRMAAVLRRPVLVMAALYCGGNRYEIHVEPLADFSACDRGERAAAVDAAVRRFAERLERFCRMSPYNWFNFYDFWRPIDGPRRSTRPRRAP